MNTIKKHSILLTVTSLMGLRLDAACNNKGPASSTKVPQCTDCSNNLPINGSQSCSYEYEINGVEIYCSCGGTHCVEDEGSFQSVSIVYKKGTCQRGQCSNTVTTGAVVGSRRLAAAVACPP